VLIHANPRPDHRAGLVGLVRSVRGWWCEGVSATMPVFLGGRGESPGSLQEFLYEKGSFLFRSDELKTA